MKCADCCFYWQEDNERIPHCHFVERCVDDKAPCDYDEDFEVSDIPDIDIYLCDSLGACPYPYPDCRKCNPIN